MTHPKPDPTSLAATQSAIYKMIKEHKLQHDKLSADQLAETIRQMLEAGDFLMHMLPPKYGDTAVTHYQSITYIPFQRMGELNRTIHRLEERIAKLEAVAEAATYVNKHRDVQKDSTGYYVLSDALAALDGEG